MRKLIFLLILLSSLNIFAQSDSDFQFQDSYIEEEMPEELIGIWKSPDRYIFFGKNMDFSVILKMYYGWYYDVSSSTTLPDDFEKDKNNASFHDTKDQKIVLRRLKKDIPAWELSVLHEKNEESIIPLCVIQNKIYLDFLIKDFSQNEEESFFGFFQGVSAKEQIRLSKQNEKENIFCYFITPSSIYSIRFWQTDMEYQKDALATFNDSKEIFKIKKHIQSCGKTYTCATGKRARIRNVEKFTQIPNDFAVNSQKGIIPIGKPVYEKEENPANIDELIQIVKEANKKRHPLPKCPFEKHEVDWHWSLIWELEKYNPVIKEVRKEEDYKKFMQQKTD